jgi:hypothetical protein
MYAVNFLNVMLSPLILLAWFGASAAAQDKRGAVVSKMSATNVVTIKPTSGNATSTNTPAASGYEPISFETLAAFPIKVDWVINTTNSAFDTLRREGEIPAPIQALHGKKVSVQGYLKPLKQDVNGVTEFLLMRDHALCCQTNIPKINAWVHVRMKGPSVPFVHERQFVVRGMMHVGELRSAGNVVSVYRLAGDEIIAVAESR